MLQKSLLSRVSIVIPLYVVDLKLLSTLISRESIDLFGEIIIVVNGISADPDILLVDCLLSKSRVRTFLLSALRTCFILGKLETLVLAM